MHNSNSKKNRLMSFQCVTLEFRNKEQWIPVSATRMTGRGLLG
ncbi:MAG: WPE palindromic element domain-containing protein [Wolbachia sp.]